MSELTPELPDEPIPSFAPNRIDSMPTEGNDSITYTVAQPDPNHLVLEPTGKEAKNDGTLTLKRVPLPAHYPLEDRGFHFVNEWGLER